MEQRFSKFQIFTSSSLKMIAIITMFIDHFGAVVVGGGILALPYVRANPDLRHNIYLFYRALRLIGRLAFPIYCFLLVEGFLHTRNRWKYLLRLGLFTLISELPFDYAIYNDWYHPGKQNVFFTLFFGMLVMILIAKMYERFGKISDWSQVILMAAGIYLGYLFKTDYGARGVALICILYLLRFARPMQCFAGGILMAYETTGPLAFVPVLLYNGQRGNMKHKFFFYWFYPAHLLLLGIARDLLLHFAG